MNEHDTLLFEEMLNYYDYKNDYNTLTYCVESYKMENHDRFFAMYVALVNFIIGKYPSIKIGELKRAEQELLKHKAEIIKNTGLINPKMEKSPMLLIKHVEYIEKQRDFEARVKNPVERKFRVFLRGILLCYTGFELLKHGASFAGLLVNPIGMGLGVMSLVMLHKGSAKIIGELVRSTSIGLAFSNAVQKPYAKAMDVNDIDKYPSKGYLYLLKNSFKPINIAFSLLQNLDMKILDVIKLGILNIRTKSLHHAYKKNPNTSNENKYLECLKKFEMLKAEICNFTEEDYRKAQQIGIENYNKIVEHKIKADDITDI